MYIRKCRRSASLDRRDFFFLAEVIGTPTIHVKHLNVCLFDNDEFLPQSNWVRNNQLLGYETNVGTKRLVSLLIGKL